MSQLSETIEELNNVAPGVLVAPRSPKLDIVPILHRLCREFEMSGPEGPELVRGLSLEARQVLIDYAPVFARDAVRQTSADYVVRGLTALAIADGGPGSYLDTNYAQAHLLHSAGLLGMDAIRIFDDAASLSRDPGNANRMRRFPESPGAYDLRNFGLCTQGSGQDFRYADREVWTRRHWWATRRWARQANLDRL